MENKFSLTRKILLGLVIGAVFGILLTFFSQSSWRDVWVIGLLELVGGIFINSIKMLVVPMVFVSLVCGVSSMGDVARIGRIGVKTMVFYLVTTAIAISLALVFAIIIEPGSGLRLAELSKQESTIGVRQPLIKTLQNIIPQNPVNAMAEGNMLQIIFIALLTGISISMVGTQARPLFLFFDATNAVIMKMVLLLMTFAPYGVFALIARTFATVGIDAMLPLIKYTTTVLLALLLHLSLVYMTALKFIGRLSPWQFFKNFLPAMSVAFSTASSNGTLPVTIETATERCGVSESIASFTLPLGATINMDGTAIMQGVAVVFLAQIYGVDLTPAAFLTVVLTATMASIGTAGVPGVGLITLSMVIESVNLPVEGIALIIGVDRLLDMSRTVVNITGDAVCTLLIARSENEFNEEIFSGENTVGE